MNATVKIISGPHAGGQSLQKECDFDIGEGYRFRDLPALSSLTLRASAPGYVSQEKATLVNAGGSGQFNFNLRRN